MRITRSSRRQFLAKGVATFSSTLLLKACQRDFASTEAPVPPSPNQPTPTPSRLVTPTPISSVELTQFLHFISIPPKQGQKPAGLIVALHGNGSTPQSMAASTPVLNLPEYQFLFPSAPFSHPSVPGGKMWYDLTLENNKPKIQNYNRLEASRQRLTNWLKALESSTGVPLSRTILSGFSQGGAMTLDVGLTLPLAGLVCLSGYLHPTVKLSKGKIFPPVLMVHGIQDQVIPLSEAHQARDTLTAFGVPLKYQEFDMGHEMKPEVVPLVRKFILDTIGKAVPSPH